MSDGNNLKMILWNHFQSGNLFLGFGCQIGDYVQLQMVFLAVGASLFNKRNAP